MKYIKLQEFYTIRNEVGCSYIVCIDRLTDTNGEPFAVLPIPQFMGYIISRIGRTTYETSVAKIAAELGVSCDAVKMFVSQLIENKEHRKCSYSDNISITLPCNLLVASEEADNREYWEDIYFCPSNVFVRKRPSMPFSVNLMVTTRCTTDCIYCYANRGLSPQLSADEIEAIIKQAASEGVINLSLTGGDIFAFPEWRTILKTARESGYHPFVSTKTPIGMDDIKFLKSLGYRDIQFSLDSCDPAVLRELIKVDGEYINRVSRLFQCASEMGLDILVRSVITKKNASKDHVGSMYEFLCSFPSVKEWVMTVAFFSEYKSNHYQEYVPENNDLVEVYNFAKRSDLKFKVGLNKITKDGYKLKRCGSVEEFVCDNQICLGNTTSIFILANGKCSLCEMLYDRPEYILGDTRTESLREIWNGEKAMALYFPNQDVCAAVQSPCGTCSVFQKCKGDFGKRVCYLDIMKTGGSFCDPDPRCPLATENDKIL
ncbi:MAG: radical SAM protein [Muribaculaceae bacterium]|nr:radical SAM protein [Muribaculaceae bacterium]